MSGLRRFLLESGGVIVVLSGAIGAGGKEKGGGGGGVCVFGLLGRWKCGSRSRSRRGFGCDEVECSGVKGNGGVVGAVVFVVDLCGGGGIVV